MKTWPQRLRVSTMALAAMVAAPVHAAEVARSDDGAVVLEAGGFYKSSGSVLALPPSLIEATTELGTLLDETRAQLPPELQGSVPFVETPPALVGLATHTARLQASLALWPSEPSTLRLEVAWQVAAVMATSAAFASSTQAGVLGSALVTPARRLIDFDPFLVEDGGLRLQHTLDRLSLTWQTPHFGVVVGRQALSWGTGRLWNPTDLLSPFAPTDVDREVRRGFDAVRLTLPVGAVSGFELMWLPQPTLNAQGFVVRGRTNVASWDVSAMTAKIVDDLVLGAEIAGDLGPLGVHGEVAWTLPMVGTDNGAGGETAIEDDFVRAVVGIEGRPAEAWVLGAELHYNGFGSDDVEDIVGRLRDPRVVRGEVFGAGQLYLGVLASWLASDLVSCGASLLVNVNDPSALLLPSVEWWVEQRVLLRAAGYLPLGAGVDVDAFRTLEPADVLTSSDAFQKVTSSFGAQSEYGLTPAGAFVQLVVSFD